MKQIIINHPALNAPISFTMAETELYVASCTIPYSTASTDNKGERCIKEIAKNWLKYQSYIDCEYNKIGYSGHRWWANTAHTIEERYNIIAQEEYDTLEVI